MNISGRKIGVDQPPYIIAEMSNNHLKDLDKALKIIEAAAASGADAIKIQTYDADSLTIDCRKQDFLIQGGSLWDGKYLYELYQEIAMPKAWTKKMFDRAHELGITIFSSPFDEASVDLLESLDCPAYKIASFEAHDYELVRKVASTGKPLIISSGVSTFAEIQQTVEVARKAGAKEIAVLHCISSYPARVSDMNLRALLKLRELDAEVGLSDHSLPNLAPISAIALGATIIEKHFTLSRNDGGPDADFSLEPDELSSLCTESREAWEALGSADILTHTKRQGSNFGRSLYIVADVKKGEKLTKENVRSIRPGFGLPPKHLHSVIGKTASCDIERGTALEWSMVNE